jgi:hypothetical protein
VEVDPTTKIDALIGELDDWRGEQLVEIRRLIHEALPGVEEEWKWMGSHIWEQDGIIAVGNAHKNKVKLTFPRGAHLDDPQEVFNAGLGGKAWRAIDLLEGTASTSAPSKHSSSGPLATTPRRRRPGSSRAWPERHRPGQSPT